MKRLLTGYAWGIFLIVALALSTGRVDCTAVVAICAVIVLRHFRQPQAG
jgi:hypothetical protein